MSRLLSLLLALLLMTALAGPALAAGPSRGCPNDRFVLLDYEAFRALSMSVGVPEDLIAPEAVWQNTDRSGDGLLCVMDLPDTPGTFDGWVFNVVDNTANR